MDNVKFISEKEGQGAFIITESGQQLGEMKIGISGNRLIIYHTEIVQEAEGKGFGKTLLQAVVKYARSNALKVKTLCIFAYNQFKKHPDQYSDIWQKA